MTGLAIVSVNPLEHAREIKDLFRVHDRPEFPGFFDRAYPPAVQSGARSWVGMNADGRIVMHSARFARRFTFDGREVNGGLMVNLMVARTHRAFIPAARLLTQVVRDTRREGAVDFLYADPNERGRAISLAGGFRAVGTLNRFVLPISHDRWVVERAIRAYHVGLSLLGGSPLACTAHAARHFDAAPFERPRGRTARLRAFRPPALYAERLAAYPHHDDHWLTFHAPGGSARDVCAAALIRGPDSTGRVTLHSLWRPPTVSVSRLVLPLVDWLRAKGVRWIQAVALSESAFARELRHSGFVVRREPVPIVALPLTDLGRRVVDAAPEWELMRVDCDR